MALLLRKALQKKPLVMLDITLYMSQDNVICKTGKILHISGKTLVETICGNLQLKNGCFNGACFAEINLN
jgi:hypothetical protein